MSNPIQLEARLQLLSVPPYTVFSVEGAVESILGYSPNSFLQGEVTFPSLTHTDDQDVLEAMLHSQVLHSAQSQTQFCNLRVRQANGRIRCLVVQYAQEFAVAGPVLNLWLRDAKSLFDPEDALAVHPGFRSMMENTNDFIFFKDRNHVFTSASQTLVSVTQPSVHWTDLIGLTDYDVFPEEYADVYYRLEKQVFAGLTVAQEVQQYETLEGSKGWVDNRKYPIRNAQGEITGLFGIARVITEQVRAEQALRQERETLQLILDYAPIGIWLQDGNGKIAFVNKAFCQATGIAEAQFRSVDHYAELIPEEFRPQCLASDARALASAGVSVTHQRLPFVDGQIHDLRVIKAVKRDGDQRPVALVGLSLDISEEINREQALLLERDSTRNILATVEAMIVALDTEGRITLVNRKGCQLLGYTEDELIGQDWFATCLPRHSDIGQAREVFQSSLADNLLGAEYFENPVRTRNGGELLIAWHNSTICDKDGNVIGGLSAGEDITERRLKERELQQREHYQRALLDNFPFAVWLKDIESRFLAVNAGFVTLFGARSAEELVGKTDFDIAPAELAEGYRADDRAVLSSGKKKNVEEEIVDAGSTRKWFETYKAPVLEDSGRVVGTVGFARDITERRAGALAMEEMSKALATSRDLLQQVIDTAPICVFWKDREGRYLGCNPAFAHDAGKSTPSELIGRDDFAMGWAAQADLYRSDDQAVMQTGQPRLNYEEPQTTPDGKIHWLRTSKVPLRDATGLVIGLLGLYDDITEQKRAERRLALALDASKILVWEMDFTTGKLDYDGSSMKGLGLDKADAPDTLAGWLARVHSDDRTRFTANVEKALQPEDTRGLDCEYRFDDNAGGYNWLQSTGRVVQRDLAGRPLLAAGYSVNIDERRRSNESLRLAANVFTHAREGIIITDRDANVLNINAAFSNITGYSREEVLGKNPRILNSGKQDKAFYAGMWHDLQIKGYWYGETWNRRKDGEVFAAMQTISAVCDERGDIQNYIALFSDISTIKQHQAQLDYIAHYDALTGLPNRLLLGDRLQQAMVQAQRRQQQVAVTYLDLDGFKAINDHHGHQTGDQVLITLAQRMKEILREGDTIARMGGDEFVAVLIDLQDPSVCVSLLGRLLSAAAEPVLMGELSLQVSASLGVTYYPQAHDIDADQLLRQADQAMYQAKVAGKNRYHVFDAVQDSSLRSHHESLGRIGLALENREFMLHYQPKVNMQTGQVVGAEALIRWQHPEKGLLAPALFLPVIEDEPLAVDVGEWVIDTALTQIELWHAAGLALPVSVNIGARQLQQDNFVARLQVILARHPHVNPTGLQLEVLETSALADMAQVSKVIEDCAHMGVKFALDDFGTGYSSLTYLKRLHVTLLKIDQSFVRDMLDDPEDLAILQGVIGLAEAFKREVIAEGVEKVAQGTTLLQLGCELAQGYGIARPMPADQMPGWAAAWRCPPAWASYQQISHDNLPLLHAAVEHRAWIVAQERYIKGESAAPSPLDPHMCRFGLWLEAERRAGRGDQPGISTTNAMHQQIHTLANELCQLFAGGRAAESVSRLGELYSLRDALLGQMKALETSR